MNKFLLGTTALISAAAFTAPALAAEKIQLELRGYHVGGISFTDVDYRYEYDDGPTVISRFDDDYNEINFGSDSEVHFRGATTLDNGLEISFRAELELENDSDVDGDADQIDEVYIQAQGGFGRLQFGQNDGAMYQQHIAAPNAFVGHGVNQPDIVMDPFSPFSAPMSAGVNTYGHISGDNTKLTYISPNLSGFQFGASFTPNACANDTGYAGCLFDEFGQNFIELSGTFQTEANGVTFGLSGGYGQGQAPSGLSDPFEWSVGGELGFYGFTLGGSYREVELSSTWEENHWDAGVSFETGPWNASVTYGTMELAGISAGVPILTARDVETWVGGVTYMYGPGMQLGLGIQSMESIGGEITVDYFTEHEIEGLSVFLENVISF